jgi:hypothetical protein
MWLHLIAHKYRDITRCVNRATPIDQIQQARKTLENLLALLQSAPVERDRFVFHLYQSRREYRRVCETAVEVRQANRAVCHLDIPDRREHGLQGRIPAVGALIANWGLISCLRLQRIPSAMSKEEPEVFKALPPTEGKAPEAVKEKRTRSMKKPRG